MKKTLFILFLFFYVYLSFAQDTIAVWGKQFYLPKDNYHYSQGREILTVDNENNVIISFHFYDSMYFDTSAYYSKEKSSGIILKYDESGKLQWVFPIVGKSGKIYCNSLVCDTTGNIYIAGYFNDNLFLSPVDSFKYTRGIFVIKLDPDGKLVWARGYPGQSYVSLSVTPNQNLLILRTSVTSSGSFGLGDSFFHNSKRQAIGCLDQNGNMLWVRAVPTGTSAVEDNNGHVYLAAIIDSWVIEDLYLDSFYFKTNDSYYDLFVARLSPQHVFDKVLYVKNISTGSPKPLSNRQLCYDGAGHIYLASAYCNDTLNFANHTLYGTNYARFFIAKLDTSLQVLKIKGSETLYENEDAGEIYLKNGHLEVVTDFTAFSNYDGYIIPSLGLNDVTFLKMDTSLQAYGIHKTPLCLGSFFPGKDNTYYHFSFFEHTTIYIIKGVPFNRVNNLDKILIKADTLTWNSIQKNEKFEANIYPNPASKELFVFLDKASTSNSTCSLYDLNGKLILQRKIPAQQNNHHLILPHLNAGLYIVEIRTSDEIYRNKLLIQTAD
jgi:hypothetical protein